MKTDKKIVDIPLKGDIVNAIDTDLEKKYNKYVSGIFGSIVCKLNNDGSILAFIGADNNFYVYSIQEKAFLKQVPIPFDNHVVFMDIIENTNKVLIATYKNESYVIEYD